MMETVALELVPPDAVGGFAQSQEIGRKVAEHARTAGLTDSLRHLMIPGMIAEDPDRPVDLTAKMDVLDFWNAVRPEIGDVGGLCTQVTAFDDVPELTERLRALTQAGMDGIAFVGVPRTMSDGEGPGIAPTDAMAEFTDLVPNRGAILIPTREGEQGRFGFKCERGATYGMTQLLYSDRIVEFLRDFASETDHRPEILLSFGFIPAAEQRVKLIDWLIQDPGNPYVESEQAYVARVAEGSVDQRKKELVELYKRVIDGVGELGFPVSIHLETPYGPSLPAFEMFAEMLDYWSPLSARSRGSE